MQKKKSFFSLSLSFLISLARTVLMTYWAVAWGENILFYILLICKLGGSKNQIHIMSCCILTVRYRADTQ